MRETTMNTMAPKDVRKLITKELKEAVRAKSNHCFYCGRQLYDSNRTIDHIVPITKGGTNELNNLVCCCHECNQVKGGETIFGAIKKLKIKVGWCNDEFPEDKIRKEKYLNYIHLFEEADRKIKALKELIK